jgi:hypothetical protein
MALLAGARALGAWHLALGPMGWEPSGSPFGLCASQAPSTGVKRLPGLGTPPPGLHELLQPRRGRLLHPARRDPVASEELGRFPCVRGSPHPVSREAYVQLAVQTQRRHVSRLCLPESHQRPELAGRIDLRLLPLAVEGGDADALGVEPTDVAHRSPLTALRWDGDLLEPSRSRLNGER